MPTDPMHQVVQHLRRTVLLSDGAGLTDGQLLECFIAHREDAAFAALVRRHGAMVWAVCRRLLRNHHDAEDAFQATFLVLVRKAASIVPKEMLPNWLFGVAHQTALKARATAVKRKIREQQVVDLPEPEVNEPDDRHQLQDLLDQELSRLPEKYRAVIVLCDLEGKTGKEAAQQLGWPEGTVTGRLSRGRTILARRLTRHGLIMAVGTLAEEFSQGGASGSVPTSVVFSTIKATALMATGQAVPAGLISATVVTLAERVVQAMFVSKIKSFLAVLLVVGVVLGGVGVGRGLLHTSEGVAQEKANQLEVRNPVEKEKEEVTPAKPQVFNGHILRNAQAVSTLIGRHGVVFIRSEARLDELNKRLPDLTYDKPLLKIKRLPKIDFAKESIVLIYALGSFNWLDLNLTKSDLSAYPPELGFSLKWYNGPVDGEPSPAIRFIYAVIPATPKVGVTLTSSPTHADRFRIVTELLAQLGGKDGGDIVDGLRAAITPKGATVKSGDDILIDFALHLADPGQAKPEQFGNTLKSVFVWDGKYSEGYRNHAFFVTTPDGNTALLRSREIKEWGKNAPHPVEITATKPYHLPTWIEGDTLKSLKALGLDTTNPGTYTITGLYEEIGQEANNPKGGKTPLWGGSITSNTITVEVKAGGADSK